MSGSKHGSLLEFVNVDNITLGSSQFINVNMTHLGYIATFTNTSTALVDQLTSYGCTNWIALCFANSIEAAPNSLVKIQSSQFHDTMAGAALVEYHNLTIQDSTFTNVNSTDPLIYINDDSSHLEMSNCTFENVVTPEEGPPSSSIIAVLRSDVTITNSSFINCSANYAVLSISNDPITSTDPALNGTWLANETVTIDGCTFYDNFGFQAPIYMLGKDTNPTQTLNIYNSNFTDNAGYVGAAVTAFAVGTVQISNCIFEANEALSGMGAIYV